MRLYTLPSAVAVPLQNTSRWRCRQLDILLPKYMAMIKQMSNYSFKWVGLYPRNIRGPPPPTPDLDIPSSLILTGMPRRSGLSSDVLWGQMVSHPTAAPPTSMTPSITSRLCILFKTGRRTSSTFSGPTPSCPGQIWSTVAQELVTVTDIIPRPEAANTLNLTLCYISKVCHNGEPADSTLKASKAIDP